MRILILAMILTGCQACGSEPDVDAALQPVLDRYLNLAPNEGSLDSMLSLKFGDSGDFDGVCNIKRRRAGGVVLYERFAVVISDDLRALTPTDMATVMHELAHCLHGKDHVASEYELMGAEIVDDDAYWSENLDQKVREALK